MRIVSLLASGTEIVCGLGAGPWLVGRSHECDNPSWVQALPVCTRPAFDTACPSRDIDAEVKRRLRSGEPLYHVDADLISRLEPDLVIAQVHCDVCAVTPQDVARAGAPADSYRLIALSAATLADIDSSIREVAEALGLTGAADALRSSMARRLAAVGAAVARRARPSVVLLEWLDPVFIGGNWAPQLIEAAGGRPLISEPGRPSMAMPWERVIEADPDCVVVAPCGFDLERTAREAPVLETLPGWRTLSAVRHGRVAIADGNRYFNRSGLTVVDTVELLAEFLHGLDTARHRDAQAWRMYTPLVPPPA